MKKVIALVLTASLLTLSVSGCSVEKRVKADKLNVVTTIYPEYDWVKEIAGESADITLLLDNGVDMHSYQPSVDDIMTISSCDVFIYVGGESDVWVGDALKEAVNKEMKTVNLMAVLGDKALTEEALPGINDGGDEEDVFDEHVWLSVKNADVFCKVICETLSEADPVKADLYKQNADNYRARLAALDREYEKELSGAKYDTLVFGDRFPFRYLTEDYGLSYYAAFDGCSAETEASFKTVAFLAEKLDELQLPAIITIDNGDAKLANTIIDNTRTRNRKVISLDSMQSTGLAESEDVSYISIMQDNLGALKTALN